jgi:hypothetical protein
MLQRNLVKFVSPVLSLGLAAPALAQDTTTDANGLNDLLNNLLGGGGLVGGLLLIVLLPVIFTFVTRFFRNDD